MKYASPSRYPNRVRTQVYFNTTKGAHTYLIFVQANRTARRSFVYDGGVVGVEFDVNDSVRIAIDCGRSVNRVCRDL